MIREFHVADWFTLGNAACGTASVMASMAALVTGDAGRLIAASLLIFAALVFDVLDGRIARWRQKASPLGRELDSLADVISFGVAPAALGYACGLRGLIDQIILVYFVACGVSRLARYNITAEELAGETGKVAYFEGTPIPTSAVLVAILAVAAWTGAIGDELWLGAIEIGDATLHPLALLYALSGSLMISRVRIPKL